MRYTYTLPSVASPTSLYPSAPFRFNSETLALETDRSGRIFVPRRLRERVGVDGYIAIIALHDRLESRSPEEWNSLDLLTWAEPIQETLAPDAALESACMEGRDPKSLTKPGRRVRTGRPSETGQQEEHPCGKNLKPFSCAAVLSIWRSASSSVWPSGGSSVRW